MAIEKVAVLPVPDWALVNGTESGNGRGRGRQSKTRQFMLTVGPDILHLLCNHISALDDGFDCPLLDGRGSLKTCTYSVANGER